MAKEIQRYKAGDGVNKLTTSVEAVLHASIV
jgi:hypothetical protein